MIVLLILIPIMPCEICWGLWALSFEEAVQPLSASYVCTKETDLQNFLRIAECHWCSITGQAEELHIVSPMHFCPRCLRLLNAAWPGHADILT